MNGGNEPTSVGGRRVVRHILIVDDDLEIRNLAAKLLRAHGYRVTAVRDGREMWPTLKSATIDLLVLDLMLPGSNGLELCRDLRKVSSVPIIMLTALGAEADRIVGLELGADDYLAKPFNPRELLVRVNAVLRRVSLGSDAASDAKAGGTRLVFDGWTLDLMRRELINAEGVIVDLSTGEYDMLLTFLEAPQRVLTREQLLDAAKNRVATGFDRVIDVQISRLRRKLEPSEESQAMIKTIRGVGYMFVPSVHRE